MSHFAKVEDGVVVEVISCSQDFIDTQDGTWIQTSYNTRGGKHYTESEDDFYIEDSGTPLRKNYAGIGYTYDSVKDAFYAPQPYPSWILDEDTCLWGSPIDYPNDGKPYLWNEDTTSWVEVEIPE